MNFETIRALHKQDPAILALGKTWLPLAIGFFHHVFKVKHEVSLAQDIFREQLDLYLEHVNATLAPAERFKHDADYYLNRWSREDDLIRVRPRDEGYIVQLSPHAERLIGWFEAMQNRGMVGTESRLRNILSLLDEVVTRSTDDIEKRLQQLYERRDQIEAEIERIETTQEVDGLSDVQIRERLEHVSSMASQLLRDFSLLEERFREMARTIQQAQLDPQARRGDILGSALDADEQLENSDEGQSFRAFYELLTHPQQRQAFDNSLRSLFEMPRLHEFVGENVVLQRLTSHLLDAGDRVNQSNQRLAEHLRRVVDRGNIAESRRVQQLSAEIKHIVSQLPDNDLVMLMKSRRFHQLEAEPDVDLPLERPLFEPPEKVTPSERPKPAPMLLDDTLLTALYDTFHIDERALRENVKRALMSRSDITLAQLIASYPVKQGVAEVIAYVQIASRDARHTIDHTVHDEVSITTRHSDEPKLILIPRIIFRRNTSQVEVNHVR